MFEGTDGHVALVAHWYVCPYKRHSSAAERVEVTAPFSSDDGLKAAAYLTDALFDEATAHSYKPEHAPVSHAYDRPIFDFFAAPGNEAYLKRFGMAMYAINSIMQGEATLATGPCSFFLSP